ncbi:MAG: RnfABCDGE type electron transport complex subunit D [Candidatus Omnitrophica bacterium]|nr:RnfABCDGE type electron transport complex subunit D [Candidatus Omnitrophota bacterium]
MKLVKKFIEGLYLKKSLKRFKPVIKALDEFFFGTDKVTYISLRSPHILDNIDIKRYMFTVIIALMPSVLAAIYLYGLRVILVIFVSYLVGGMVEVISAIFRKKEIQEGFLVTGLIFPLLLPPTIPLWMVGVGIFFGVFIGKEIFGGTGRNIFNPALVGRLFITISFPQALTTSWAEPLRGGLAGFLRYKSDALTSATPLISFKSGHTLTNISELLMGLSSGSIGETFRLGVILGGLFLLYTRVANWRIPLAYLSSVFILSFLGNVFFPDKFAPPLFQLFSGGLLLGAFFMATDPVTSPFSELGKWIFGFGCGLLTVLIRTFSGYVEGVMFSIIIMNGFSPLIDQSILNFRYRYLKR